MTGSRSVAVWAEEKHQQDEPKAALELHFNYWRVSSDPNFVKTNDGDVRDFIEIGILITNPKSVQKVAIYVPTHLPAESIDDCGPYFEKTQIAQAIFNEPLSCTTVGPPGPQHVDLDKENEKFCRVHKFSRDSRGYIEPSELTSEVSSDGTLLTITDAALVAGRHNLPTDRRLYFRLRAYLTGDQSKAFVRTIQPKDRLFLSGFDVIEYVDFRLNEARTLPSAIETAISKLPRGQKVPTKIIAFLTAIPISANVAASSAQWYKSRLLEHQIWNEYVHFGIPDGMIVYHWKRLAGEEKDIPDFSAFVKTHARTSSSSIISHYLFYAFAFAIFGNLAASLIIHYATPIWKFLTLNFCVFRALFGSMAMW